MATKIPFNVVFSSDEDVNFPASELNNHGPAVHGWRSEIGSTTCPHDIVLRFHKPAKVCRIQILAHQYLIPEKVELWLHYSPKSMPSTPSSQLFDFLGFIALSDNSATECKSRELQSVSVNPKKGTHLKLRLYKAHNNEFNKNGQIALIAINILGEELSAKNAAFDDGDRLNINGAANGELSNCETEPVLKSICDDLLFSMYVEDSIAQIIRQMEERKTVAVSQERFEYARKLKLCMTTLRHAGERLGRYALAKRQAVQQEDFTTARLRKEQIEMYREAVLKQLLVADLLESHGIVDANDMSCEIYASKPQLPPAPSLQDVAHALAETTFTLVSPSTKSSTHDDKSSTDGCSSLSCSQQTLRKSQEELPVSPKLNVRRSPSRHNSPMSSRQGSLRRRNKSAPRNSYEDYEERAIPTLRHSTTNEFLRECQGSALLEADAHRGRSRLNDRERRQAALPILVFGNDLVEQFYSRQFQDREDGLLSLRNFLKEHEVSIELAGEHVTTANKVARSAALLLHRAVRDAVYSVFNQATETVRVLFLEYVPDRVSASEVARCVDRLLPELLAKSGDPSARIHTLAQHTILSIAACPEVADQHLVAPALSRAVSSSTHPRLALSRMQMLEQLVLNQGMSADKHSGLTCRVLAECGCSGIHHPAEPVRKVAERILLLVYKVNPRLVRKKLPPDDDITRRNLLYRQLFSEFDRLDLERKCEMFDGNKGASLLNSTRCSTADSTKQSKLRNGTSNLNSPYEADRQLSANLKSKSAQKLGNGPSCSRSVTNGNGLDTHNGKQQYNEQVKRSMNRKGSQSNSNSESIEETNQILRCPFCDWNYNGDVSKLDRHYWKSCPFLTKCPQCSQVLEVAALNYHLINECDAKDSYVMCERCTESVHKQLYDLHQMEDFCRELKTGAARCPLCHDDVNLPLDGGWKLHLMSKSGCSGNSRRRSKILK